MHNIKSSIYALMVLTCVTAYAQERESYFGYKTFKIVVFNQTAQPIEVAVQEENTFNPARSILKTVLQPLQEAESLKLVRRYPLYFSFSTSTNSETTHVTTPLGRIQLTQEQLILVAPFLSGCVSMHMHEKTNQHVIIYPLHVTLTDSADGTGILVKIT